MLPDGTSERANLVSAAEKGSVSAQRDLAGPSLPPDGEHVWRWFEQLAAARSHNGFGPNPLNYQDILAWSLLTGTITRSAEVAAIMMIDRVWLNEQAKQRLANRPRPKVG